MSKKKSEVLKHRTAANQQALHHAERLRALSSTVGCLAVAVGAFWLCAFKIFSNDFWFHLKVGEMIVTTRSLLDVEPFSYTLEGRPFSTHYEYLSQIVFYLVYHFTGATGFILFRSALVAGMGILLLSIDRKNAWPNALLVLWALNLSRAGFIDRPQLFTFLFFILSLVLVFRYVNARELGTGAFVTRKRILAGLAVTQLLWANFHGGATIMGLAPFGALCGERMWHWVRHRHAQPPLENREPLYLLAGGFAMILASLISPDTYRNYTFLSRLAGDSANPLIKEWQARPWGDYLREIGPFWYAAGCSLLFARRNMLFSLLLVVPFGCASNHLFRLSILFLFTACAVTFHQLQGMPSWHARLATIARRPRQWTLASVLVVTVLLGSIERLDIRKLKNNDLFGYGISAPAARACDFLERQPIQGRLFNSFDLGAYLIYRGYPGRKVFIDGRNADYGADFVRKAAKAGYDARLWSQLDQQYQFSHAVVNFSGVGGQETAFITHLDRNPLWKAVYFDDRVAVYAKDHPDNSAFLRQWAYRHISPLQVEYGYGTLLRGLSAEQAEGVEAELERLIASGPSTLKGRLVLAMHYAETGRYDRALQLAKDVASWRRNMSEPYEIMGMVFAARQAWAQAGDAFEQAIQRTPTSRRNQLNYGYIATLFERAGNRQKAGFYQKKALRMSTEQRR